MTSPDSPSSQRNLGEVERLLQRARRRNAALWVAATVWAVTLVILAGVLWFTIDRFAETERSILKTQESIEDTERLVNTLQGDAQRTIKRLRDTQATLDQVQEIQQKHTSIYALRLQDQQGQGVKLRPEEEEFLELVLNYYKEAPASAPAGEPESPERARFLANDAYFTARNAAFRGDPDVARRAAGQAVTYYERALSETGGSFELFTRLGSAHEFLEQWPEAARAFQAAADASEDGTNDKYFALKVLGLAQIMTGAHEAALASLNRSADIARGWQSDTDISESEREHFRRREAGALENIGIAYLRERDWARALRNTDRVLETHEMTWNYLIRAIAADKLGRRALAAEAHGRWLAEASGADRYYMALYLPDALDGYVESLPE